MRLTEKELILFRNNLLATRSLRHADTSTLLWEPWMEHTLRKITDELYPQEMDLL